jgi:hypothetical protein
VTLTFGDLSSTLLHDAPKVLPALFATTVVVAGYWLARTYIAFHNAQECLQELDKDAKKVDISAARSAAQQAATRSTSSRPQRSRPTSTTSGASFITA